MIRITWAMMIIGNLALTGFPFTAGYFSKDAIIESAYAASWGFAFWLLIVAAFCTSFYSWRLAFMTFHGTPRADTETMEHVHESPNVMLIPLYRAGGRRACGGLRVQGLLHRPRVQGILGTARWPTTRSCISSTRCRSWVVWSPFVAMVAGLRARLAVLHPRHGAPAEARRSSMSRSTSSCSTSGTSTSFMT